MRLKITHLKAPWPQGAAVGDVVEMPAVPEWAAGKCHATDEKPTAQFVANVVPAGLVMSEDAAADPLAEAAAQAAQETAAMTGKAGKRR